MTQAAKRLLEQFDALPDPDRAELVAELLRRTAFAPHDLPEDDDLVAAADRLFRRARSPRAIVMKSPQRGEVWLVDLGMAAKVRPAVVISVPADETDRALVTLFRTRRVLGVRDSKWRSGSRFFAPVHLTRRISLPFRTPNWSGNWDGSQGHNLRQSSARVRVLIWHVGHRLHSTLSTLGEENSMNRFAFTYGAVAVIGLCILSMSALAQIVKASLLSRTNRSLP